MVRATLVLILCRYGITESLVRYLATTFYGRIFGLHIETSFSHRAQSDSTACRILSLIAHYITTLQQ